MLQKGLSKLSINDNRSRVLLEKYTDEIERFNPAYGLVKVRDRDELIVKHILDSLAPIKIINGLLQETEAAVADVGSGAGLPGIPLAVCIPGADFALIERMGRRAGFLRNVQALLSLDNVRIEEAEMEKVSGGRFDLVVFRALKPLEPSILKGLFRLLAPGGILAAYKGRREFIEEELAAIDNGIPFPEIIPIEVPFLEDERHLVLIRP